MQLLVFLLSFILPRDKLTLKEHWLHFMCCKVSRKSPFILLECKWNKMMFVGTNLASLNTPHNQTCHCNVFSFLVPQLNLKKEASDCLKSVVNVHGIVKEIYT